MLERKALKLLDDLIDCWTVWDHYEEYYLTVLVPSIVCSVGSAKLKPYEEKIVLELRGLLSQGGVAASVYAHQKTSKWQA